MSKNLRGIVYLRDVDKTGRAGTSDAVYSTSKQLPEGWGIRRFGVDKYGKATVFADTPDIVFEKYEKRGYVRFFLCSKTFEEISEKNLCVRISNSKGQALVWNITTPVFSSEKNEISLAFSEATREGIREDDNAVFNAICIDLEASVGSEIAVERIHVGNAGFGLLFYITAAAIFLTVVSCVIVAARIYGANPSNGPVNLDVVVGDEKGTWSKETSINLFNPAYYSSSASEETAKSRDGRPIVAPGTEGVYSFNITNESNNIVDVIVDVLIDVRYSGEDHADTLPLLFKVFSSLSGYIVGGDLQWGTIADVHRLGHFQQLEVGQTGSYMIRWKWDFDNDDEVDTMIGNMASQNDFSIAVSIPISVEAHE
ncbi:MAG: hypothetical protein J6Y65_03700 [Eggerthellaceae bacterium]|nr:hypothetical protein [Eggerthellaceae bacterium]